MAEYNEYHPTYPASPPSPPPARPDPASPPSPPPWAYPAQPPVPPAGPPPGFRPPPRGGGHAFSAVLGAVGGVVALAGIAAGVIFVAHPFGIAKPTASVVTAPQASVPAASPAAVAGTPESASAPAVPARDSAAEQQAADSLSSLLSQSVSNRQQVNAAFNDVEQCGPDLAQDVQTFQDAQASRQQLLGQLTSVPGLDSLPQSMIADLQSSWQASATVDGDYVAWAQDQLGNGCSSDNQADPNYTAADAPNSQATSSKTAFVQQWNPLAQAYGLTTYSPGDF